MQDISYELISELPDRLMQVDTYWTETKNGTFAPARKNFDLMGIPASLVKFASVTDYNEATDQFTFRFFGTGFVDADGVEMTGKTHMDIPNPSLRNVVEELSRKVVTERKPCLAAIYASTSSGPKRIAFAGRWPLSDDGERVTGILTVADPELEPYDLNKVVSRSTHQQVKDVILK
jgi:hypothetical protein